MTTRTTQDLCTALVKVIESPSAGLLLTALAADVIAADARFNYWFATVGKQKLGEDSLLRLVDMYDEVATACQRAVGEFESSRDKAALTSVLTESLKVLKEAVAAADSM